MKYFNKDMTYFEAFTRLTEIIPGKSSKERREIQKEYSKLTKLLLKKESKNNKNSLTSYETE